MDEATNFTFKQLADWASYEEVRTAGLYNMFDPRARLATGLDRAEYQFVMNNYSALRAAAEADADE